MTTEPPPVSDPPDVSAVDPSPTGQRRRRWRGPALTLVALLVGVLVLTSFTGFPGPGGLRRYPTATLNDLVDAVHANSGDLRTPDDCWRTTYSASRDRAPDGPPRSIAAVDHLRSRVVVRAYADQRGNVDDRTADAITRRLDQIVRDDPRFERSMIVVEPSPDGWSPLMSCPLVIRGWL